MQISQHFTLAELTVTASHYPNVPDAAHIESLTFLASRLELIRDHFGPLVINSAFRSPDVNREAGGAPTSQHLAGEAADFHCPGVLKADIWHWIVANGDTLQFDQVIAEYLQQGNPDAGWIHCSFKNGRSRKSAISCIGRGNYLPGFHYVGGASA